MSIRDIARWMTVLGILGILEALYVRNLLAAGWAASFWVASLTLIQVAPEYEPATMSIKEWIFNRLWGPPPKLVGPPSLDDVERLIKATTAAKQQGRAAAPVHVDEAMAVLLMLRDLMLERAPVHERPTARIERKRVDG